MTKIIFAFVTAVFWLATLPAIAADADVSVRQRAYSVKRIVIRPYMHVVEVAVRPPGVRYVINGSFYTGISGACFGWGPKQRLRLLAGDWNGRCSTAVFRNVTLGQTCEMTCG